MLTGHNSDQHIHHNQAPLHQHACHTARTHITSSSQCLLCALQSFDELLHQEPAGKLVCCRPAGQFLKSSYTNSKLCCTSMHVILERLTSQLYSVPAGLLQSFDELVLLKPGGRMIYGGPTGHNSEQLIDYFQALDGVPRIQEGINPATWMLEVTRNAEERRLGLDFAQVYRESDLYRWVRKGTEGNWQRFVLVFLFSD